MRSWNPRTGEFRLTEQRKPRSRRVWLGAMLLMVALGLVFAAGQVLTRDDRDDLPRLVKRVQPAVITVMAYDAQGRALSQGSGFFITPAGRFLTNYHVLAQAARAEVKTSSGRRYRVKGVVAADRDWDLAVAAVVFSHEGPPSLEITSAVPEVGERVVVVGSPLGLEQTLSDGVVSAVRRVSGAKLLQISAPVSPGSSGSPVINMRGEVAGVAFLQVIKGQNLNFAVPGSRALALQRKAAARTAPTPLAALERNPGLSRWYLDRSNRYAQGKQGNKAVATYRQDIPLQPDLAGAFSGLGRPLWP
jgi:serine protease Do